jgi:hypothetical protein
MPLKTFNLHDRRCSRKGFLTEYLKVKQDGENYMRRGSQFLVFTEYYSDDKIETDERWRV